MSRRGNKRLGLIGQIIWLVNIVFALTLLLSYLASYVDPAVTTLFSFLGLAYLPLLLLNLLFFLYWLIRRNRRLWLSLIVFLTGFNIFTNHIQLLPGREAPEEDVIRILSYNVQNMAFTNTGRSDEDIRNDIISFLQTQDADIVCIQEYSSRGIRNMEKLSDIFSLGYPYAYFGKHYLPDNKHYEGKIILSRFPVVDTVSYLTTPDSGYGFGLYVDMLIHGDTIRVYNLHLESIGLRHEDYKFVSDVAKGRAQQADIRRGSSSIIRKLQRGFYLRSGQTQAVVNNLLDCPYRMIILGDFNDTPLSYAYHKISDGLDDAFIQAGYGLGNTFTGNLPPLRIDHILYSPEFQAYDFQIHKIKLSDHFPVSTYLSLTPNE